MGARSSLFPLTAYRSIAIAQDPEARPARLVLAAQEQAAKLVARVEAVAHREPAAPRDLAARPELEGTR
jgi:hypothetical protein